MEIQTENRVADIGITGKGGIRPSCSMCAYPRRSDFSGDTFNTVNYRDLIYNQPQWKF